MNFTIELENLVLELLRGIRADLSSIKEDMREIKASLERLGTYWARP